jgi:hypothetical protein
MEVRDGCPAERSGGPSMVQKRKDAGGSLFPLCLLPMTPQMSDTRFVEPSSMLTRTQPQPKILTQPLRQVIQRNAATIKEGEHTRKL